MSSVISIELTITKGKEIGRRYALRLGQTFLLGRSQKVAVCLDDPLISRHHASLELRPAGLVLTDHGSRNGTFLDGERVEPHEPIDASSAKAIEAGNHTLSLRLSKTRSQGKGTATLQAVGLPNLPSREFQFLGLIGEGSSGTVYSAEQKLLRRKVAIKVLLGDDGDEFKRERFLREGWICSQIQSPHVVDIYDVRSLGGQVCMIMELVQGPSAQDRLKDGPLPLVETLRIGEHVARALQAAGEVGIVHRDVKPSNILLDPSGLAKLSDFGIAKGPIEGEEHDLTPMGRGLGTLAYVSPEQALDARSVDARADIYALGATLYHLISGHPPFRPETPADLYKTFDLEPERLEARGLETAPPPARGDLIHCMLGKAPEARPGPPSLLARLFHELRIDLFPESGSDTLFETGAHLRPNP